MAFQFRNGIPSGDRKFTRFAVHLLQEIIMAQANNPQQPARRRTAPAAANVLTGNITASIPVAVTPVGSRPWFWPAIGGISAAIALGFLFFSVTHVTDEGRVRAAESAATARVTAEVAARQAAIDAAVAKVATEVRDREAAIKTATDTAVARATAEVTAREAAIRQATADARAQALAEAAARQPTQVVAAPAAEAPATATARFATHVANRGANAGRDPAVRYSGGTCRLSTGSAGLDGWLKSTGERRCFTF